MDKQNLSFAWKLILSAFFIVPISCQEEEILDKSNTSEVSNALEDRFTLDKFDETIKGNLTIDWETQTRGNVADRNVDSNASRKKKSDVKPAVDLVEFDVDVDSYLSMDDSASSMPVTFKLVAEEHNDSLSNFTLVKFLPAADTVENVNFSYI